MVDANRSDVDAIRGGGRESKKLARFSRLVARYVNAVAQLNRTGTI